jgi:hypothetical protein
MLPPMCPRLSKGLFLLGLLLVASPLNARVVRVEIDSRTDVLNGRQFGDAGAYERIQGHVYFSLPVANPHNQPIVDLRNAVNLKDGKKPGILAAIGGCVSFIAPSRSFHSCRTAGLHLPAGFQR